MIFVKNTYRHNFILDFKEEPTEKSTCSSASNIETSIEDISFEDSDSSLQVLVIPQPVFKNEEHKCNERWILSFHLPKQV